MSTYSEQFLDPRWQKKRLKILERDNFTCQECGSDKNTLHIHHKYYLPNKKAWEHPDTGLVTLCKTCHEIEQSTKEENEHDLIKILYDLGFLSSDIKNIALGFIHFKLKSDRFSVGHGLYKFLSLPSNHEMIAKIGEDYGR